MLVPNVTGLKRALKVGVEEIAVFTAASETFNRKNINRLDRQESIERFVPVLELAKSQGLRVRGYVSCALGCPYEGEIAPEKVASVARELVPARLLRDLPRRHDRRRHAAAKRRRLIEVVSRARAGRALSPLHFHDTYGQALANVLAALEMRRQRGRQHRSRGLGGCPYAAGASGNVASEDVLYMLNGLGIATGVDLDKLAEAGQFICTALGRAPASKVALALEGKRKRKEAAATA